VINSGTVLVGNGGTSGQLPGGTLTINGAVVYNRSDNPNLDSPLAGTGTLYQNGTGTVALTSSGSFAGNIVVNSGAVRNQIAGATGSGGTITLNNGTYVAAATINQTAIVFNGGTLGSANNPAVLTSGDLYVNAGTTSKIIAGDPQNSTDSNGTLTGSVHGTGTLLTAAIGTGTTTDGGPGIRFSGTASDFNGTLVVGPNVKGEITSAVAGPYSPLGTGSIIMTGGTTTGTLGGTYSELNLRNNRTAGDTVFGNNLFISGTGVVVLNPLGSSPSPQTSTLGTLRIGDQQVLAVDKNSAGVNSAGFNNVVLLGGNAGFQPVTPNGGWSGTVGLIVGAISQTAPSSITMSGLGTFTMTGNNTYTGGTNVQSGTLITSTNLSNGPLTITGGTTRVAQKAVSNDPAGVTIVPSISIAGGSLDLTNNAMVIDYTAGNSPLSTVVRPAIVSGFASGSWNGVGINNTLAATAFGTSHPTGVGYAEASTLGIGTFAGHSVDSTSVLLRYTLLGDANVDGVVNALDFNAVATNFGNASANLWTQGDFNYDGQVNTADFTALAQNFAAPLVIPAPPSSSPMLGSVVPEPASLGLLSLAGLLGARRRRIDR
jgi:autotransporter-associated beta strand protein